MIEEHNRSLVGLALAIAGGVVVGSLVVAAIFWVLGAIVHIVAWAFHIAVIAGVVALVWWLVAGRRRAHRNA
jgi:hypothetical protein